MTQTTNNRFANSTILVTGANRGLGRALVQAALDASAKRVYAAARDPRTLEALVRSAPDRVAAVQLDVTDAASVAAAARLAPDVDVLINNAGVLAAFDILTTKPEDLMRDFATNTFGIVTTTKAFLPALSRNASGVLVNVLSIVSLANMPALGGYSAAKAAAYSLTQGLRPELTRRGVSVHAVLPGPIDTDMVKDMPMQKTSAAEVAQAIIDGVNAGAFEIFPDPASREMNAVYRRDPSALAAQLSGM